MVRRKCRKCGKIIPISVIVDGKKKRLTLRRKYCLECSPFGAGNRKRLEPISRKCPDCGKTLHCGIFGPCFPCKVERHRKKRFAAVRALVGNACWLCGYGGKEKVQILELHHVDSSKKSFRVNKTSMTLAWDRVIRELKKCVLLCCRCHREAHVGLVPTKELERMRRKGGRVRTNAPDC